MTQASAGRITKQEHAQANTLESYIRPLRIHFSTRSLAEDSGAIRPHHQNEAI